ncbi:hypothetical protein [Paraburkholderia youngii]|uniref:hypothetical protein n=1 Tax=Paraburkholderia youngii TaxID=2782701 RepID=UPI003D1BD68F
MKQNIATGAPARHLPAFAAAAVCTQASAVCSASDDLPAKEEIDKWCVETVKYADALLMGAIVLPRGHEWWYGENRFNWGGSPSDSIERGASLFIRKQLPKPCVNNEHVNDPDQVHVEIRTFLPTQQYRTKKGTTGRFRNEGDTRYSALLWVTTGSQYAGKATTRFATACPAHPGAATLEEFATAVSREINAELYKAIPSRMPERMNEMQFEIKVAALSAEIKRHEAGKKNPALPLSAKIEHNRARNRAVEELRELRANRFALTREQT